VCVIKLVYLMRQYIIKFSFIFFVLITSCVPHKNTQYFNNRDDGELVKNNTLIEKQEPYRVQIGDVINIVVKASNEQLVAQFNPTGNTNLNASSQEQAYFDGFTINAHGDIRIPVLGKMKILGYTTEEIEKMITDKLNEVEFKEAAEIFVTVKLAGFKFTINGEIEQPGTQILFQDRVNIFEAIANSGEIPLTGNRRDVLILRQYPQGYKIHHLDLTDVKILNSPYYYLQPNDIITVQALKQKSWGIGTTGIQTLTTILSAASLITTTILLINRF